MLSNCCSHIFVTFLSVIVSDNDYRERRNRNHDKRKCKNRYRLRYFLKRAHFLHLPEKPFDFRFGNPVERLSLFGVNDRVCVDTDKLRKFGLR
jgi:hypothetical protein